jgi:DNA primase
LSASPNEESFPHKKVLYGADKAKNTIVVVEGPADAWAIGPGAVAVFGLEVSTVQYREISSYPTRVICFDNQPVAARRADKLASRLCKEPGDTYIVRLESGKDPADSDPQELLQIRKTYLNDLNEKP